MKSFIVSCSFAALVCVFIVSLEARPELRQKRALNRENCPSNMTMEQCQEWAAEKHKNMNECVRHEFSGTEIVWADCGTVHCGENTREVPADLTKPYPGCCPKCEAIDPTKPATWSIVG